MPFIPYNLITGDLYKAGKSIKRVTPNYLPVSMIENSIPDSEQRNWFE